VSEGRVAIAGGLVLCVYGMDALREKRRKEGKYKQGDG
jgi:small neutral amino acid transporter SnatA (MarC family)